MHTLLRFYASLYFIEVFVYFRKNDKYFTPYSSIEKKFPLIAQINLVVVVVVVV